MCHVSSITLNNAAKSHQHSHIVPNVCLYDQTIWLLATTHSFGKIDAPDRDHKTLYRPWGPLLVAETVL